MATTIDVESNAHLERLLSTDKDTEKALVKLIRQVLKEARKEVADTIHNQINDPRGAAYSIRRITYKKLLGGNLNIDNMKKKAGKPTTYVPERKLREGQRGGNRVQRGRNTERMMSYGPHDRAMVLRWISGTGSRQSGTRGGHLHGSRGRIVPRNLFSRTATPELNRAAERLAQLIDTELSAMLAKM